MGRRRWLAFLGILVAFAALARWVARAPLAPPPLPEPAAIAASEPGPPLEFTLPDLTGASRSASEWRGRWVLLNFWAVWCGPCREELPSLDALERSLGPEGLSVVAVSLDEAPSEDVARFVGHIDPSFAVLHDREQALAERVGVRVYPTSLLLDRAGRVRVAVPSAWEWSHPDTLETLRRVLATAAD